jgi:TolB-like protein
MHRYRSSALTLMLSLVVSVSAEAAGAVTSVATPLAAQVQSAPAAAPPETVAVIPFTNISGSAADAWIGDGIAETVTADLESQPMFVVVPREQIQAASAGRVASLDDPALVDLGRALGARWVVAGGYQRVGDQLRITARLVDTTDGMVARTLKTDGTLDEIFDLQDQIASELTGDVGSTALARSATPSLPVEALGEGAIPAVVGAEGGASFVPSPASGGIILPADGRSAPRPRGRDGRGAAGGNARASGDPGRTEEAPAAAGRAPEAPADGAIVTSTRPSGRGNPLAPDSAAAAGILSGRVSVTAPRSDDAPRIDGRLDDAIWRGAARLTEFVQQSPLEGVPATEDTEVFIAYDDDNLYFGIYAHYSDPSMVRAARVDRDQAGRGDDTVSVYFDTFLDQQRAYVFTLNGYGVQGDSLLDSRGGGGGGGGGGRGGRRGGFGGVPTGDRSWDALFASSGTLVEDGWTAEMSIPFKSLRYPSVGSQAHRWGFQIARQIRGKNETVVWAPISRDVSGFLRQMGLLDGMSGLSTSRNLEILPTVTAVQVGSLDTTTGAFPGESQPEGGLNLKYGITSNLTLDATFNPDFSQIESDRPQIAVNQRFPLFFPELRPFFLEGQEIFNLPGPVNFVHTRTIVDPRYGGKVTGKVGKTTVGMLIANDEAPGKLDDISDPNFGQSANVLIGRVRYDMYSESHLGAIVTDREFGDTHSRLAGVDGNFRLNGSTSIGFRAITTQNRDVDSGIPSGLNDTSGNMFDVGMTSQGRNLNYFVAGYTIAPDFNTDVGFVRRRDIRAVTSRVGYRWWPEGWLINWGPEANYGRNYNFAKPAQNEASVLLDEERSAGVNFSFAKNIRVSARVNRDLERFGGINFNKTTYSTNAFINTLNAVSVGGFFTFGDQVFFGESPFLGKGSNGSMFLTLRPHTRLQSQINISTSRLTNPLEDTEVFDVKIYRALTTYQFTNRLLLRNILQYNTFSRTVGANVLLTYRVNSGTVFFIGYDDRYQQGDLIVDPGGDEAFLSNSRFLTTDLLRTNRAFFTKISYLFRY